MVLFVIGRPKINFKRLCGRLEVSLMSNVAVYREALKALGVSPAEGEGEAEEPAEEVHTADAAACPMMRTMPASVRYGLGPW